MWKLSEPKELKGTKSHRCCRHAAVGWGVPYVQAHVLQCGKQRADSTLRLSLFHFKQNSLLAPTFLAEGSSVPHWQSEQQETCTPGVTCLHMVPQLLLMREGKSCLPAPVTKLSAWAPAPDLAAMPLSH